MPAVLMVQVDYVNEDGDEGTITDWRDGTTEPAAAHRELLDDLASVQNITLLVDTVRSETVHYELSESGVLELLQAHASN